MNNPQQDVSLAKANNVFYEAMKYRIAPYGLEYEVFREIINDYMSKHPEEFLQSLGDAMYEWDI